MANNFANLSTTLVATAPSPATSGTSLVVTASQGSRLPATPFFATACPEGELPTFDNAEIVEVTNVSTDTITIVRAQKGTTAQSIAVGWRISASIYAEDLDGYQAPIGSVLDYAGLTEPDGWLFCYGQAVSRTTYADLFTAIGNTYGAGDGSTTFNLPDLRGRVIAGQDDMGGTSANRLTDQSGGVDGDILGDTGGAETHTLTTAEMPAHTHTLRANDQTGNNGSPTNRTLSAGTAIFRAEDSNVDMRAGHIAATGSGSAHNNVQPTIILNKIIKATYPATPPTTDWESASVTLTSKTIDGGSNTITGIKSLKYSTSEVNTGETWVDSLPIYKKTINFGTLPNNGTTNLAHSISNIDTVIKVEGIADNTSGTRLVLPYAATTLAFAISLAVTTTNITVITGTDRTSYTKCYVTVYYTKSA